MTRDFSHLLKEIRQCTFCVSHLPLGPRPVIRATSSARMLIIGQAPGTAVHQSGIPWDDPSGRTLRSWLKLSEEQFYDETRIAIMPMGFCYPGKGRSGDNPPRKECAPKWHDLVFERLPDLKLVLLVGLYAIQYYLPEARNKSVSDTIRSWYSAKRPFFPLPHPSPRNRKWISDRPWFEQEVVPALRNRLHAIDLF